MEAKETMVEAGADERDDQPGGGKELVVSAPVPVPGADLMDNWDLVPIGEGGLPTQLFEDEESGEIVRTQPTRDPSVPLKPPRVERFANDCVIMSQVDALRRNYPNSVTWMATSQWGAASSLARKVAGRIEWLRARYLERYQISASNVLNEVANLAFSELPGIIGTTGGRLTLEEFSNLSREQRRCIKRVRIVTIGKERDGRTIEAVDIELHDKLKALELLGKHLKTWGDDHRLGGQTFQLYLNMTGGQTGLLPVDQAPDQLPPVDVPCEVSEPVKR